ncbi:hypothetical protein J2W15_002519 [Pseudarthrobacter sulfonivorans]|nr:hypothetical protein [Pseudarthrobacter sulfonivorans]
MTIWWNGVIGMLGDLWRFVTTDSFGQQAFFWILGIVAAVCGWLIKRHMDRPKKLTEAPGRSTPDVPARPNSAVAAPPKGPLLRYSSLGDRDAQNAALERDKIMGRDRAAAVPDDGGGLWSVVDSHSRSVFSLVNAGETAATEVSISSHEVALDSPKYWERLAPQEHQPFALVSALDPGQTASLTVRWTDRVGNRREARVGFPT